MKQIVVTITGNKLILEIINPKAKDSVLMRSVFDWKKGELEKVFKTALVSTKETGPIRILLAEDFYYAAGFKVDAKLENDRDKIRKLAEEVIPEDLERVRWDYVVVGRHEKSIFVQCFALTKFFDKELLETLEKLPEKVEVIEPYALALMESFKFSKSSFLLLHKDEIVSLGVVVKDGLVVFSKYFDFNKFDSELNELVDFSNDFYKLKSSKLLLSGVDESVAKEFAKSFKISKVDVSANVNLAEKTSIKGKDSKVLNLQERPAIETPVGDLKSSSGSDSKSTRVEQVDSANNLNSNGSQRKNIFYFVLVLLLISMMGTGIGFFVVGFF